MYCIGNKPGLGAMETAYIPHNHTLTVYHKWKDNGKEIHEPRLINITHEESYD